MRRKESEITNIDEKLAIINANKVCRIGLADDGMPYVVPLNYGWSFKDNELTLFFHGAKAGKKLDIIKKNNNACFEIDCDGALVEGKTACRYGYAFQSVIGFGKITVLDGAEEKKYALTELMCHQTGRRIDFDFEDNELNGVAVYKLTSGEFTGKRRGVPEGGS